MKTKKLLSLLLAVMMILSSVPMFASAAPIALTTANITEYPVANFINEDGAFIGMTVGESITLSGGKVCYDSNGDGTLADDEAVPGHFEIVDPDTVPNLSGGSNNRVSIKFVPDDETTYAGFEALRNRNVQYLVQKTTPVFVDENDTIPVATKLKAGDTLSLSTLSGAEVTNPYNANEPKILKASWTWNPKVNNPSKTIVTESGYYEAYFLCSGYVTLTASVWVGIEGDTSDEPSEEDPIVYGEVTSWPTIECPEWTPGMTVADLTLTGGEATVEGTFAITTAATTILKPNTANSIKIVFTPANSDVVMTGGTTKTIQITPTFTVKDITVTVDPDFVCTYEYGTRHLGSLSGASAFGITTDLPSNIRANVFVSKAVDKDGNAVDTYNKYLTPGEYTARIAISIPKTELDGVGEIQLYNSPVFIENIPIVITKQKSTGEFASLRKVTDITEGEGQSTANIQYKFSDKSGVDGYCVLKVNGETVVDNIASAETSDYSSYLFTTNTSGKFTATLEYIPAETDYIEFETTVLTQEFELEVLEPEIPIIPGGDDDGGITLPDLDLDTDGSHKFSFVNIIKNLVEALKAFIQQIGDFFSNLSLDSLGEVI